MNTITMHIMNKYGKKFLASAAIYMVVVVMANVYVHLVPTWINMVLICMATMCATLGVVCLIIVDVIEQQKASKEDKEGQNKSDKEGFEIIAP